MVTIGHEGDTSSGRNSTASSRAEHDFSIEFLAESESFAPNDEGGRISASLKNLGTNEDTYVLEIKLVPVDWTIYFENGELVIEYQVLSDGFKDFDLIVRPPESGDAYIELNVTSKATGIKRSAFISLLVKQPIIEMKIDSKEKTVMPDGSTTFNINLTNLQDVKENVTIELKGTGILNSETPKPNDWTYLLNQSRTVKLESNSSILILITIHSPIDTVADDKGVFTIKATPDSDENNPIEFIITVIVEENLHIDTTLEPEVGTGKPNGILSFTVTLENDGTGDLTNVELVRGNWPAGWELIYNTSIRYSIERDQSKDVDFKVKIPDVAIIGQYKLQIDIWANSPDSKYVGNYTIKINVSRDISSIF
jgi:uncharacterized membrane protein